VFSQFQAPAALADVKLADETTAPALFVSSSSSRSLRGVRRDDAAKERRERRVQKVEKHDVEREVLNISVDPPAELVAPAAPGTPKTAYTPTKRTSTSVPTAAATTDASATAAAPSIAKGSEDKMQLESLLNYVAFNRKDQQRTFLVEEKSAPPPPPPQSRVKRHSAGDADAETSDRGGSDFLSTILPVKSASSAEKANADAQMVLKGAINYKCADVAKDLYEELVETKVEISESTFTLMIESCILASDLKNASDFLMKMESSGYCPDADLLDKVMDLYSQTKIARDQEKQNLSNAGATSNTGDHFSQELLAPEQHATSEHVLVGEQVFESAAPPQDDWFGPPDLRPKLSSGAAMFVPMSGIPSPPPPPLPMNTCLDGDDFGQDNLLFPYRTALSASAKPFQPDPETLQHSQWNEGLEDHGYCQPPTHNTQPEKGRGVDVGGAENSSRPVNRPVKHSNQPGKKNKSKHSGSSTKKGEPSEERSSDDKKTKTWKAKDKNGALKPAVGHCFEC